MTSEALGKTGLARSLADVLGDISELLAKQIQLAKFEVMANIGRGVRAAVWAGAAAFLLLLAAILVVEALSANSNSLPVPVPSPQIVSLA